MQRKTFRDMPCPIARSLERIGEWWSILILREAFYGATRFDTFQKNLEIAPSMLTRRLNGLVEEGLMERRQYSLKPPRFEYVLTGCGRDFLPVMLSMLEWGNKYFAPEGISAQLVDKETGQRAEPVLVDAKSGKPVSFAGHAIAPGPAATEGMRRRLEEAGAFMSAPAEP